MSNLTILNSLFRDGLKNYFIESISDRMKRSVQDKKITAFVVLIFTFLGLLAYRMYCWHRKKPRVQQEELERSSFPSMNSVYCSEIFRELQDQTNDLDIPTLPFNKSCRFSDIFCPIETHVDIKGETNDFYLHANHVYLGGIHMILTQYPLPTHLSLFWDVCKSASLIVDLTNDRDMQKGLSPYTPSSGNEIKDDPFTISHTKEELLRGLNGRLYSYEVEKKEGEGLWSIYTVNRLHYQGWNDHQGISEDDLDRMVTLLERYQTHPNQPIVIHCRAGVGRSGTIAVAYALHALMKQKKVDASNVMETIRYLILEGRKQRGRDFVQTSEQLEAIWKWGWRAVNRFQFFN